MATSGPIFLRGPRAAPLDTPPTHSPLPPRTERPAPDCNGVGEGLKPSPTISARHSRPDPPSIATPDGAQRRSGVQGPQAEAFRVAPGPRIGSGAAMLVLQGIWFGAAMPRIPLPLGEGLGEGSPAAAPMFDSGMVPAAADPSPCPLPQGEGVRSAARAVLSLWRSPSGTKLPLPYGRETRGGGVRPRGRLMSAARGAGRPESCCRPSIRPGFHPGLLRMRVKGSKRITHPHPE